MSDYPEHDKMHAVQQKSQPIGEFLEWLAEQGVRLMVFEKRTFTDELCTGGIFRTCQGGTDDLGRTCRQCGGTGRKEVTLEDHWPWEPASIEARLARYFEIDLDKVEAEKRAMLASLRA